MDPAFDAWLDALLPERDAAVGIRLHAEPAQGWAESVLLHLQDPPRGRSSRHLAALSGPEVPAAILDLLRSLGDGGVVRRCPGATIAVGPRRAAIAPRAGVPVPARGSGLLTDRSLHLLHRILAERTPDLPEGASTLLLRHPPQSAHDRLLVADAPYDLADAVAALRALQPAWSGSPALALRAGARAAVVLPSPSGLCAHVLAVA